MTPLLFLAETEGESASNPFIPAIYDIVWSIVPFAVIVIVFAVFILPKFRSILDERAEKIEGGIERAEAAQAEAQRLLDENESQRAEARAEAARIREQARSEGQAILAELKEQAQAEAARVTQTAHQQIEAERQAALVSLRAEVGALALDLASGVIGENLSDDKKSAAMVDRFLAELETEQGTAK